MQAIRKQIHLALLNVSRLCDQFFRKYPQYYPPQTPYEAFPPFHFGGYPSVPSQHSMHPNHWINSGHLPLPHPNKIANISKEKDSKFQAEKNSKPNINPKQMSKKSKKQMKKEQKKLDQLKRKQEKQQMKLDALKSKRRIKNTLKSQIRKDPRLAERPKFPMSPYFLYLKEMRLNLPQNTTNQPTSKEFAEQMGKNWREMTDQRKKPYVTEYLKEKRKYDENIAAFYEKYPDLKPKNSHKKQEIMYSVDDPKYQTETVVLEEQQLENDLIDELNSQEDDYKDINLNVEEQRQFEDKKKLEDSLTLSDERIQLQSSSLKSPLQVVEID